MAYAGLQDGSCAHRTGLKGDVQRTILQPPSTPGATGGIDHIDLRVTERCSQGFPGILTGGDHLSGVVIHQQGTHGDVTGLGGRVGQLQCLLHILYICGGKVCLTHAYLSK
jgi:hypothetical protein